MIKLNRRGTEQSDMGDEDRGAPHVSRWHPRDRQRADGMGLALIVLGVALHGSLLFLLGPAPGSTWFQGVVLAGQVCTAVALTLLRPRLPAAFWAGVTTAVTPVVALVSPFYPQATLVVVPIVFLLVLFTASMLSRLVARVVAAEGLMVAGFVIVQDPTRQDLMLAELFFVLGALTATHVLLVRSTDAQAQLVMRLQLAAGTDALTGLMARRAFEELVDRELAAGRSTALVVVDVDRFKVVNDTYGHPTGDAALQHIAAALAAAVRTGDAVAGRLGGDEFAVVMCDCTLEVARRRAQEMAALVADRPMVLPFAEALQLGVSVGVATADSGDLETLYAAADAALYQAKAAGRGCVVAATAATPPSITTSPRPKR